MTSTAPVHVLVVEDDADYCRMVARMLEAAGFRVTAAADFARAMAIVESGQPIDLLLTDIGMPPGTPHGVSIALAAQRHCPDLPIVYMTGGEDPKEFSLFRGDAAVLRKPFTAAQLIDTINAALAPGG